VYRKRCRGGGWCSRCHFSNVTHRKHCGGVDSIGNIIGVTGHTENIMEGGGQCWWCRFGDVACRQHHEGW